ncbi:AAA family ATPase [Methanomethylophilus alvi]|uniref:AAA family ATPase n=1 Tax=Methanomethylophilus alvi TaxID=1291540 RepID=UPI0037DCDBEF
MKQIDAGGLSFRENRRRNKYYVDKTLLIKDILESNDSGVFLFTRPRRFGKTTNLTMMDAFFNIDYKGDDWFDGLAISQIHGRKYYMGMKGRVVLFGISFWVKVPKVKVEIVEI